MSKNYRCRIYAGKLPKRAKSLDDAKELRKSDWIYVTALTPELARNYVQATHGPGFIREGEVVVKIAATQVKPDVFNRAIGAPRLL